MLNPCFRVDPRYRARYLYFVLMIAPLQMRPRGLRLATLHPGTLDGTALCRASHVLVLRLDKQALIQQAQHFDM